MNLSESLIEIVKKVKNEFGIILSVLVLDAAIFFKIEDLLLGIKVTIRNPKEGIIKRGNKVLNIIK